MKTLVLVSALLQPAPAAPVPALYSFDDVYRLTVAGPALASMPPAAAPVRVAVSPPPKPDSAFAVRDVPAPERSLLLIAGLAAAFWVARRRLAIGY